MNAWALLDTRKLATGCGYMHVYVRHLSTMMAVLCGYVWVGRGDGNHNPKDKRPADLNFGVVSSSGFKGQHKTIYGIYFMSSTSTREGEREPENCWQFSILILRIGSQSLWKTSHGIRVHLPWGMRQNAGLKFIGRTRPRISLRPTDWHILYPFPLAARNGAIINSFRHLFDISTRRNLIVLFAPVFVFVFRSPRICVLNDMYKGWANINPFRCVEVCGKQRPGEWSNIKRLGRGDAVIAWLISGQMAPDTNDYLMLQFTLYWFARIRLCLCQHNRGIMSSCHGQALN